MDNVETGDEDVRKNLGAIPSAKGVNPHPQHFGDGGGRKEPRSQGLQTIKYLSTFMFTILLVYVYLIIVLHSYEIQLK